jgi:hypothetical protein
MTVTATLAHVDGHARPLFVACLTALVLTGAACTRSMSLPSDPRWLGGGCRGTGTDMVIRGAADDPRVSWATTPDGGQRVEIVWPVGYSARFTPQLEVLDSAGVVVARDGDYLTGWCATADTTPGQPVWVEGGPDIRQRGLE